MGIVYNKKGKSFVFEAVEPVKLTTLERWISRGVNQHFIVKRLKNAEYILTAGALRKMYKTGQPFKGKHYDLYFQWSDNTIYCSELVWKIYNRALGIKLGELQTFKEFDFSHPIVQKKVRERFGSNLPLDEKVISPARIFSSTHLKTVYEK